MVFTVTLACTKRALFITKKGALKNIWGGGEHVLHVHPVPTSLDQILIRCTIKNINEIDPVLTTITVDH
jgi:hypothetical protein